MLRAKADPTFWAKVDTKVPGGGVHPIRVEFKHMRKDAAQAYFAEAAKGAKSSADQLFELAVKWEGLEFEFTREGVDELEQEFPSVCHQLVMAYAEELVTARLGN